MSLRQTLIAEILFACFVLLTTKPSQSFQEEGEKERDRGTV